MANNPIEEYDDRAERYAEKNPTSPAREGYEWPAVKQLLPELAGLDVLDAGCGSGFFSARLADHGADVVGVDASERMIDVAKERNGEAAAFEVGDLRTGLDYDDGEFDLIVCQLTLEHIENWHPVFSEFARLLSTDGMVIFSTDHPFTTYFVIEHEPPEIGSAKATSADYYEIEEYSREWDGEMTFYRRSLQDTVEPLFAAGFAVEKLLEPKPQTSFEPHEYFAERTPRFIVVRARKS